MTASPELLKEAREWMDTVWHSPTTNETELAEFAALKIREAAEIAHMRFCTECELAGKKRKSCNRDVGTELAILNHFKLDQEAKP